MAANSAEGERKKEGYCFAFVGWPLHCSSGGKEFLTINSDLAIAIRVTGLKKCLCLSISQSSGTGREVLQEQPGEGNQRKMMSFSFFFLKEKPFFEQLFSGITVNILC